MQYVHRNWKLLFCAAAGVALGCLGAAQRSAQAQNSVAGWPDKEFKVENPQKVDSKVRNAMTKKLANGTFEGAEDEQQFADYYDQSIFPAVTNPENRQSPKTDMVARLRNDLKQASSEKPDKTPKDQQVFNKLANLTLAYMMKIAKDDQYHPVARVNALLAIGEVNSPKAAKVLLDTAFGRGPGVFAFRVAAMTGLVRMAGPSGKKVLSEPDIESLVVKNMVPFVKFHAKKSDQSDGINWMRGQAADVFSELGSTGPQNEVPPALLVMLNDKDLPIPLRSKAARALGRLKYEGNPPAAGPYLTALAEFARDALSSDQPANRRRVRLVALDVEEGLKPLASSTTHSNNDQALIDGLIKTLQTLNSETEDKLNLEELGTSIAKAKASLDSLLKKKS